MTSPVTTRPYHVAAGEGPALWHLGGLLTFKATSENTAGRLWVQEALGARGYATPVHRHTREDEAFYVLEGELTIHIDGAVLAARAGDFLWAPRDVAHAFCVESERARFLAFSTDGGFDRFFFDTGEPAGALTLPPAPEGPPDVEALVRAMNAYGVEMVGPPPAPRG